MADNVLSVFYELYINNKQVDLTRKLCVTSIDFAEVCSGSDSMTVNIADPDLLYISDDVYKEDTPIRVEYGWNEDTFTKSFDGYIAAIDISFPEEGIPTMTLNCIDQTHKMNKVKKKRSWDNVTNADVVKIIGKEYGFNVIVQPNYTFKKEETISQSDKTDIEFLEELCGEEAEVFICKLIGRNLYYIKKGVLTNPVMECCYRQYPWDIKSFSPQINIETKQVEEESSDISNNKDTEKAVVNRDNSSDLSAVTSSASPVSEVEKGTAAGFHQLEHKDDNKVKYDWKNNSWG